MGRSLNKRIKKKERVEAKILISKKIWLEEGYAPVIYYDNWNGRDGMRGDFRDRTKKKSKGCRFENWYPSEFKRNNKKIKLLLNRRKKERNVFI